MPDGVEVSTNMILNLLVGGYHFLARVILVPDDEVLHGWGGAELANAFEARHHDIDVGLLGQVVGVDQWGKADIGRDDGKVPS